jgi:hypothetical protein
MQKNIQNNNEEILHLINDLEKNYLLNNIDNVEIITEKIDNNTNTIKNLDKLFLILENNPDIDF